MPMLVIDQPSIVMALLGGWISIVGLLTYVLKEKLFLSDALLAMAFGIIVGPSALGWVDVGGWTENSVEAEELTYQITRIVIGIQVLFAGIALPKAYLRKEWKSLTMLLLPILTLAWFTSSLLVWGFFPHLSFLESLTIGACICPTDPVLANSITRGRFADKHVPAHVRNIIVAESGSNDGLGFPFIYIAMYLLLYQNPDFEEINSLKDAIGHWFYDVWIYQIILSCIEGFLIGHAARIALKYSKTRGWVDHESFLGYGIGLALFTLGVLGLLGGDDILACFIVGNAFTWDDYYRLETEDSAFQDVLDSLLNTATFAYVGAIIPWSALTNDVLNLAPWRFVVLGITILLFRRLPWVVALTRFTPVFATYRESAFTGWFGPIGVSAVFYVQVALRTLPDDEVLHRVRETITPVVYFCVFSSVLVHGCTVPVAKLARHPRLRKTFSVSSSSKGLTTGFAADRSSASHTQSGRTSPTAQLHDGNTDGSTEMSLTDPKPPAAAHLPPPSADDRQVQFAQPGDGLRSRKGSMASASGAREDRFWEEGNEVIMERADGTMRKLTREEAGQRGFLDGDEDREEKKAKKAAERKEKQEAGKR